MDTKHNNSPSIPVSAPEILNSKQGNNTPTPAASVIAYYRLASRDEYVVKMRNTFTVPSIPTDLTQEIVLNLWPGLESGAGGLLKVRLVFDNSKHPNSWFLSTHAFPPSGDSAPV